MSQVSEDQIAPRKREDTPPHGSADPSYARPDWASQSHEICCPLCGYNLRGLTDPVCPECGYKFEWPQLLDPRLRLHPYLFEHHPPHKIWPFFKTLLAQFHPAGFWRELSPSQPSRPRRLVLYWAICALIAMVPAALAVGSLIYREWFYYFRYKGVSFGITWSDLPAYLWRHEDGRAMVMSCLLFAAWPWLNGLALLVFQQSMGRAKVRSQHVLRCAIYSGDVILWNGLWGTASVLLLVYAGRRYDERIVPLLFIGAGIAFLLNFRRLYCAYRYYLRFDRPFATILASQVIVALAAFTAFLWVMLS